MGGVIIHQDGTNCSGMNDLWSIQSILMESGDLLTYNLQFISVVSGGNSYMSYN